MINKLNHAFEQLITNLVIKLVLCDLGTRTRICVLN